MGCQSTNGCIKSDSATPIAFSSYTAWASGRVQSKWLAVLMLRRFYSISRIVRFAAEVQPKSESAPRTRYALRSVGRRFVRLPAATDCLRLAIRRLSTEASWARVLGLSRSEAHIPTQAHSRHSNCWCRPRPEPVRLPKAATKASIEPFYGILAAWDKEAHLAQAPPRPKLPPQMSSLSDLD